MKRPDSRRPDQVRPVKITRHFSKFAEGSALIEMGDTKVICTATIDEYVPHHKKNSGEGWVTAEYSMLPRATSTRTQRDNQLGKSKGRTQEIQRLIGRSIRAVVDFKTLGERTIILDADVIQADGGTRTASITGCFVALHDAVSRLLKEGKIEHSPILDFVAAVSVGKHDGVILTDLCYEEDSKAEVDMNVVMTGDGNMVEIQGTAEGAPFNQADLDQMLSRAKKGVAELIKIQKKVLKV